MGPNKPNAANLAMTLGLTVEGQWRRAADLGRWATKSVMKRVAAILWLISVFCAHGAEGGITNLVVTPCEVDPKSVRLTAAESPQPNVTFNFLSKTPEQVRAMYKRLPPVHVVKDGVVVAKALGCTGYKGRIAADGQMVFSGLVLVFDDLEQAKIAERVLKREDKKPE